MGHQVDGYPRQRYEVRHHEELQPNCAAAAAAELEFQFEYADASIVLIQQVENRSVRIVACGTCSQCGKPVAMYMQ